MFRSSLLTAANPKTVKGEKYGFATAILHLAPADLSGHEVCPARSAGCTAACLNTAGQGGLMAGESRLTYDMVRSGVLGPVQAARVRRTQWLFSDRRGFIDALRRDMARFAAWCHRKGYKPALRLNGTSDLDWHGIFRNAGHDLDTDLRAMSAVAYDYTKVFNRSKRISDVYSLTFSLSESNEALALQWLAAGGNVAVVFDVRPKIGRAEGAEMIKRYDMGGVSWQVIDGDESDLRFLDARGVIVGLRAKANARADGSGFVRKVAA